MDLQKEERRASSTRTALVRAEKLDEMEAYGVATHNAFALLGDGEDDDPQALVAHRVLDVPQSAEPKAGKQPPREGRPHALLKRLFFAVDDCSPPSQKHAGLECHCFAVWQSPGRQTTALSAGAAGLVGSDGDLAVAQSAVVGAVVEAVTTGRFRRRRMWARTAQWTRGLQHRRAIVVATAVAAGVVCAVQAVGAEAFAGGGGSTTGAMAQAEGERGRDWKFLKDRGQLGMGSRAAASSIKGIATLWTADCSISALCVFSG